MTDRFGPNLSDQALDRVLGELRAPAPSDLLRARLDNAMATDGDGGRAGAPSPAGRTAPRAALFARLAAALLIAAFTGLGAWLPALAPGPGSLAASPAFFLAPVPVVRQAVFDDGAAEAEIGLTLVGGDGAAFAALGLVRADWSAALARAENDRGFAAQGGAESGAENVSDLEAIPLD
ncbi:MAG: hypothetical protein IIC52_03015 [Proteobacteria bacterium]|nr:hypothetical protein [Pseudomonadota bacterium]